MNILFVSAVLPYPLYSGGQVRVFNLLKRLSKKHKITLCTYLRNEKERVFVDNLTFLHRVEVVYRGRAWQPRYVLSSLGKYPFLLCTYDNAHMRGKIGDILRTDSFDGIHLEPFYVWPSMPPSDLPVVVGEHNVEYLVYDGYAQRSNIPFLKPFLKRDVEKLRYWEEYIWQQASHVISVSHADAHRIHEKARRVTVVPNGVDTAFFRMRKALSSDRKVFLFVGSFRWIQNQDAALTLLRDIWPRLQTTYPDATLRIVGRSATSSLRRNMNKLGVQLVEYATDIRDEFRQATALLAPIKIGSGTSYKILEAMASGVPVITSTLGAEGLEVTGGTHLMICNTPEEYYRAVSTIIYDTQSVTKMTQLARTVIEKHYSWERISDILDGVWRQAYE